MYHKVSSFDTQQLIEVVFEQSLIYLSLHIKSREVFGRKARLSEINRKGNRNFGTTVMKQAQSYEKSNYPTTSQFHLMKSQ